MSTNQQAKCEGCGDIFTLGVNGVTRKGHDYCDQCAHVVRAPILGFIIHDPYINPKQDLTEEEMEQLR